MPAAAAVLVACGGGGGGGVGGGGGGGSAPTSSLSGVAAVGATQVELGAVTTMTYLDSPATTSATTYKVQGAVQLTANSANVVYQYSGGISTMTLLEIGA